MFSKLFEFLDADLSLQVDKENNASVFSQQRTRKKWEKGHSISAFSEQPPSMGPSIFDRLYENAIEDQSRKLLESQRAQYEKD